MLKSVAYSERVLRILANAPRGSSITDSREIDLKRIETFKDDGPVTSTEILKRGNECREFTKKETHFSYVKDNTYLIYDNSMEIL